MAYKSAAERREEFLKKYGEAPAEKETNQKKISRLRDSLKNRGQLTNLTAADRKTRKQPTMQEATEADKKSETQGGRNRLQMERELEELRKSPYLEQKAAMQGESDNRSWEEIYAEETARQDVKKRIAYLENQLRRVESEDYYQEALKRLSAVDEETIDLLDQLREGKPDESVPMQGKSDNRSWEEIYAENQAWEEYVRKTLGGKGYSEEEIAQLSDDRQRQVNRETYEAEVAASKAEAEKSVGGAILGSLKSVPQNLTGGLGSISLTVQNVHNKLTGDERPVDYYTPEMIGQAKARATRESVTQQLEENTKFSTGVTGNVASFLYNTGMSMLDSTATALMSAVLGPGVGPATGAMLLGGTAATQAAVDAKERGVSDEQALLTGLFAGAAETVFEKISLDRLLKTKPPEGELYQRILGTLKNVGSQGAVEGSEEFFTSVANALTDSIINGDASAYQQSIYDYMSEGYTEKDATKQATTDWLNSLAGDFLGGFLSGGVMGGAKTAFQTAAETHVYGEELRGAEQALAEERLSQKAGDQLAVKVQENEGKNVPASNWQRRELMERNRREINSRREQEQVDAAAERLRELGEEGDVEKIARAAVKAARENKHSAESGIRGRRAFEKSQYGQQVVREMQEGKDWAKGLPVLMTENEAIRRTTDMVKNPKATDERKVTGAKYNAKTKKMDAIVKDEDGEPETIPMETARVTVRQQRLADYAARYGDDGDVMVRAFHEEQDPDTYARQWNLAYEYGLAGVPAAVIEKSPYLGSLTGAQKTAAYETGKHRTEKNAEQSAKKRAERAKGKKRRTGKVSTGGAVVDGVRYKAVNMAGLTEKQEASIAVMREVAKATGVNVVFYESEVNERGRREGAHGVYSEGTIYLDIAAGVDGENVAEAAILRTAAHELTHFIQDMDEAEYNKVREFVLGKLAKKEGVELEKLIERQIGKNPQLSADEAVDEVIADACEMMLQDSSVLAELAREDRTLAEKLVDFLRELMERIAKAFEGVEARSAEARAMAEYTQELQQIWDGALRAAIEGNVATKNTAEDGGVAQYSIREIDGRVMPVIDTKNDTRKQNVAQSYIKTLVNEENPFATILMDDQAVYVGKDLPGEYTHSTYTEQLRKALRSVKMQAATNLDEMLLLAQNGEWRENVKDKHKVDAQNGWYRYETEFAVPVLNAKREIDHYTVYGATLLIRNDADGRSYLYDMLDLAEKKKVISSVSSTAKKRSEIFEPKPSNQTVPQTAPGVNGKKSARDTEADNKTAEAYFDNGTAPDEMGQFRYSLRDAGITDREILSSTLDWAAENEQERKLLEQYRGKATELQKLENQLSYQRNLIRAHENGTKVLSPVELTRAKNRAASYARQADQKAVVVNKLEKQPALQRVLQREKEDIENRLNGNTELRQGWYDESLEKRLAEQWAEVQYWKRRYEDVMENGPTREERTQREQKLKLRKEVRTKAGRLANLLETNTDKKHVPEDLKEPLKAFLDTITFVGGGQVSRAQGKADYAAALQGLKDALDKRIAITSSDGSGKVEGYLDLPKHFAERMQYHLETAREVLADMKPGETVVRRMSAGQLEDLNMILSVLSKSISSINEMMANRRFGTVEKAAESTLNTMSELGRGKSGKVEGFFSWTNLLPVYAFGKLGEGGRSVFEALQDGWDKLARNTKAVIDFTRETYTDKEAKAWSEEIHTVELYDAQVAEYVEVQLTTAQIMSLWALSRREQAMGHLLGGGIRPEVIALSKTLKRPAGKTIRQEGHFNMTESDIVKITGLLTERQLEVAKKLQKFMERQGSEWGNEISMQRHGYKFFGERNYFPIETDSDTRMTRSVEKGSENDLYRLLNLSATKALVKDAANSIMLRNIFDVYANHMADMAKYNAMALPVLDAIKWYNYNTQVKMDNGQVHDRTMKLAIEATYGKAAKDYIVQFIRDINGIREGGGRGEGLPKRMISNYKRASVAANLRVAFLQPTSYVRAGAVIDPKYLAQGAKTFANPKAATKEMLEHSGIALWKSMGFFDTDVGRGIRDQIKGGQSQVDKLVEKSMLPAQKGDEITWAALWSACKAEVTDKQKLTGEKLMEATAERFREVVYATQVVDSTMTRSALMRDNTTYKAMAASFMSEPTVSYNLVMNAVDQVRADMRRGKGMNARMAIKKNSKLLALAFGTYTTTALVSALVESIFDAYRNDDDEKWLDKLLNVFGKNFGDNMNPLSKVPIIDDVAAILKGETSDRMDTQAVTTLVTAYRQWREAIRVAAGKQDPTALTYYGNQTNYGRIYQTVKGFSQLFGVPASAALREVQAALNGLVDLAGWDGLKWKTYENKDQVSVQAMYSAMMEGDREAWGKESQKWQQREIKSGAAQREALSTVRSGVKARLQEEYYSETVTADEAEKYLVNWLGMQADDAEAQRLKWDCYVVEGIKYNDIRSAYETDQIDRETVIRLRTTYGGETREEAEDKATWYDWGIAFPAYSDISETKAVGWYDYAKGAGIAGERYYQIVMDAAEQEVNSKSELVAFIRKLGLSGTQQRALWRAMKNSNWKDAGTPWA